MTPAPVVRRRTLIAGVITAAIVVGGAPVTVVELLRPRPPLAARCPECPVCEAEVTTLVAEGFNAWYDGRFILEDGAARFHFAAGASTPDSGVGTRISIAPSEGLRLSYRVKYSSNWVGSGASFHPHELYLLTTLDGRYAGLARSHLTVYVEQNGGRPVMLLQDSLNIGQGAVAGCDVLPGDCYTAADGRRNGRAWPAPVAPLTPGGWHQVEAVVRLNTPGQANGELSLSVDGTRVLRVTNAVMRRVTDGAMRINQLIIGPYMSRSPVDQTMWVDDVVVRGLD